MLQSFENSSYAANRALDGALLQAEARVQVVRQEMLDQTMQTAFQMGRKFRVNSHQEEYTLFTRLKEDFFLNAMPNQPFDNVEYANPLGLVVHHAEGRLEVANRILFDQALELAFKEGERYQALKLEKVALSKENIILKNQIEDLNNVHLAEWRLALETIESKIHLIAFKIKVLIEGWQYFLEHYKTIVQPIDSDNIWGIYPKRQTLKEYSPLIQKGTLPYVDNFSLAHLSNPPFYSDSALKRPMALVITERPSEIVYPIASDRLKMTGENFRTKSNALALKITSMKADNIALQNKKKTEQECHLAFINGLKHVIYNKTLEPCIKIIDLCRQKIVCDNEILIERLHKLSLLNDDCPEWRKYVEKRTWQAYIDSSELIKSQLDLLLSEIDEVAQEFKAV